MPKDPEKKRVQADLTQQEYDTFREEADKRDWSDMRMTENIIRWYLKLSTAERKKFEGKK